MSDSSVIDFDAKKSILQLFNKLKIGKIVCVDDNIQPSITNEERLAFLLAKNFEELAERFPELRNLQEDRDIRRKQLDEVLKNSNFTEMKIQIDEEIISLRGGNTEDQKEDDQTYQLLSDIIDHQNLELLTPDKWNSKSNEYLQDSSETNTLFLFDQDWSKAEGGTPTSGMKVIAEVLSSPNNTNKFCGLLTHTVSIEEQDLAWAKLAEENGLSDKKDKFLVISKKISHEVPGFIRMLKLVALTGKFGELKKKTFDTFKQALEQSFSEIDKISAIDFDYIVFEVSKDEGIWEPDMLFRLFSLFQHKQARSLAYNDSSIEKLSQDLRSVRDIPTNDWKPTRNIWTIQREEFYEQGEYLNAHHLPLELGDIFEKTDGDKLKKYILLAPPCDLMIRWKGKREPEMWLAVLAEIIPSNELKAFQQSVPYFSGDPDENFIIKFRPIHHIDISILDLCVFNKDGVAKIIINEPCPEGIYPPLQKRYSELQKEFSNKANKCIKINGKVEDYIITNMLSCGVAKGAISVAKASPIIISYNLKRIARLTRSRAVEFLNEYASVMTRAAFEREFGKLKK